MRQYIITDGAANRAEMVARLADGKHAFSVFFTPGVCRYFTADGQPNGAEETTPDRDAVRIPADAEALFREAGPEMSVPSWAIRFAASLPNVMVVLSGMSSMEQMQDNVSFMKDFHPLTEEERKLCFRAAEIINSQTAIPCTACSYCTDGCPMNIPIPEYFSIYNEDMREHLEEKRWTINFTNYGIIAKGRGKASECIACGQCEGVCPQHLKIIDYLKDVAKHYEK